MATYCGYCGKPVTQRALSAGECPHCGACISPAGDAISIGNALTAPDAPPPAFTRGVMTDFALNTLLSRLGAGLGVSGGTLAGVAFFLAWLTFTSTSCGKTGPQVTQSGWEMLTKPTEPFNQGLLYAPILASAAAAVLLHLIFLLLPTFRAARIAAWNAVLTFAGWASFLALWRQIPGNQLVHRVHPGFYLELTGLGLMLGGALCQVAGTMPPTKGNSNRLALLSLALMLYPLALLAVYFFAGFTGIPPTSPRRGFALLVSCLPISLAALLAGRRAYLAAPSAVARWGILLSLGALVTVVYVLGLLGALWLKSKGVKFP